MFYKACVENQQGVVRDLTPATTAFFALRACFVAADEDMSDDRVRGLADYAQTVDVDEQFVVSGKDDRRYLLVRSDKQ